jgi:hypothetical protein
MLWECGSPTDNHVALPRRKMRLRTITVLAASLLTISFGSFLTATPSFGQTDPDEVCTATSFCVNAWNGGPYVNVYTPGASNDTFYLMENGSGYWNLQYIDFLGTYWCVGDFGNSSTDARAGLVMGDCTGGGAIPWGGNFTRVTTNCPSNEFALKDNHWGGWLAPSTPGLGNGDPFYLNNTSEFCYTYTQ